MRSRGSRTTIFDPNESLIFVRASLFGPLGSTWAWLALDTGAEQTLIRPEVLDGIGYSPRQGEAITSITSAIGREPGYLIRVSKMRCMGFEVRDFALHAHDLPVDIGLDGLLGLSFLRRLNYEVRSREGRIVAEAA